MSKNYTITVLAWVKLASSSAIDRKTAIILYLLSFKGTAINKIWASTMSPMWKFGGSLLPHFPELSLSVSQLVLEYMHLIPFTASQSILIHVVVVHLILLTMQELSFLQVVENTVGINEWRYGDGLHVRSIML